MKRLSWMLMLCCLAPLVQAQSLDKQALLEQIRETRSAEQAAMREREQTFLRERNQQQARLSVPGRGAPRAMAMRPRAAVPSAPG